MASAHGISNQTSIPSPTPVSPVHPQPTMSPVPGPQRSMWQIQPSPSVPSVVRAIPEGSVHDDAPQAHNPSEVASSGQLKAIPSIAPAVTNTPQDHSENISQTIPSRPQPKRARRAELSEDLIARDLDWFKSNQGIAVVNEDPGASLSKANESSPALASDTPHIPGPSPSLKKKTARMVPSRRLPRRISLDAAPGAESGVSPSALPPPKPSAEKAGSFEKIEDASVQMDVDEQKPSLERMNSDARSAAISEARDVQEVSRNEELPSPEPQLVPTSSNGPSIKPEIPQRDDQPPSVEAPFLNGESRIPTRPSAPLLKTTLDEMESMDISTPELGSESVSSESPSKLEPTPPESPRVLQLRSPILPPLVNALEPPLNLTFKISQISPDQLQQLGMDANQRRFGDEMTVIHSTQGKPFTHTHIIDISMNQSILSKISKWVNRRFYPSYVQVIRALSEPDIMLSHSEASHGVCISLACYRLPEFFDRIKSDSGKNDVEELTSRSPCSWPHSNRLSVYINDEERQSIITLSPPLFVRMLDCFRSVILQPTFHYCS